MSDVNNDHVPIKLKFLITIRQKIQRCLIRDLCHSVPANLWFCFPARHIYIVRVNDDRAISESKSKIMATYELRNKSRAAGEDAEE